MTTTASLWCCWWYGCWLNDHHSIAEVSAIVCVPLQYCYIIVCVLTLQHCCDVVGCTDTTAEFLLIRLPFQNFVILLIVPIPSYHCCDMSFNWFTFVQTTNSQPKGTNWKSSDFIFSRHFCFILFCLLVAWRMDLLRKCTLVLFVPLKYAYFSTFYVCLTF